MNIVREREEKREKDRKIWGTEEREREQRESEGSETEWEEKRLRDTVQCGEEQRQNIKYRHKTLTEKEVCRQTRPE